MQIRILNDDGEELWVKSDTLDPKIPSSPREKALESIITSFESALQNYAKLNKTALDDRPVVILTTEDDIEEQIWRESLPFKLNLSHLPNSDVHELRFRFAIKWETVDLEACI